MGDLTKNFSNSEFLVSEQFPHLVRNAWESDEYKFFLLSSLLLQPIRDWIKLPIKITSGLCWHDLNVALGRNPITTDHDYSNHDQTSNAVDYVVMEDGEPSPGKTHLTFDWAKRNLVYGQLIHYPLRGSVHITLPTPHHYMDHMVIDT